MTTMEPRGASPVPRVQGDPGQAPRQRAAGPVGGPELVDPEPVGAEPAGPGPAGLKSAVREPTRGEPAGSGPAGLESAVPEPTRGESARSGSAGLERGCELDAGELPPRSRGVIGLLEENCTVCMLCARECPDWCIYIESHKQTVPAPEGGRPRVRNVLDRFAIDFSLCMYCGICIEACPYDALFWSPEFGYPETGIGALTHERDRLRDWMWTVPPPPAHDPGAPLPREAQAAGPGAGPAVESG
jgi:NADH-quinone oxidoreductase subunit I